jgi:hypothetical protein
MRGLQHIIMERATEKAPQRARRAGGEEARKTRGRGEAYQRIWIDRNVIEVRSMTIITFRDKLASARSIKVSIVLTSILVEPE